MQTLFFLTVFIYSDNYSVCIYLWVYTYIF